MTTIIEAWHVLPVFLLVLMPLLISQRKRGKGPGHLLAITLFAIYLFNVARYTVFPLVIDPEHFPIGTSVLRLNVNFVPFRFGTDYGLVGLQALGNLALLVPFGYALPFVARLSVKGILLWGAAVALLQEAIQLGILILIGGKTVDINDAVLNFTGVPFGLGLFFLSARIYARMFGSKRVPGVWQHFHDTLVRAGRTPGHVRGSEPPSTATG